MKELTPDEIWDALHNLKPHQKDSVKCSMFNIVFGLMESKPNHEVAKPFFKHLSRIIELKGGAK